MLNADGPHDYKNPSTDTKPFQCTLPPLPPVSYPPWIRDVGWTTQAIIGDDKSAFLIVETIHANPTDKPLEDELSDAIRADRIETVAERRSACRREQCNARVVGDVGNPGCVSDRCR